jgi:hypothetical protein
VLVARPDGVNAGALASASEDADSSEDRTRAR